MKEKIIKIINYATEAGILLIVFFVPLYFSFFYQSFSLFSLERAALFQIIVEILLFLFLLKIILTKKIYIFSKKKYLVLPIIFFLSLVMANVFSIDSHKSFWGSYMRQQGLFTYLHYFLFFIILLPYLRDMKKIEKIINTILFSSLIISVYGIFQWFGFDFIDWFKTDAPQGRVVSTLGQPVFLGNYLLLTIFLSLYKIIKNKRFIIRFYFILLFIFQFFCLIFTYSRGAWMGFIFGSIIGIIIYLYIKNKSILKTTSIFILIFISLIFSLYLLSNVSNKFNDSFFVSKAKNITNLKYGSLAMRVEMWKAGAAAISKSPIIGYGPECLHEVFIEYYNPIWSVLEDINTSTDKSHNFLLDLLLEGGLVMFISYIVFLSFIFINVIRYLIKEPSEEKKYLLLFLIISIVAYHFSLLFSFPIVETNILFWLYVGFIYVLISEFKKSLIIDISDTKRVNLIILLGIFVATCGFIVYYLMHNINSVRADYYFKKARGNYYSGNYMEMLDEYSLALNLDKTEEQYVWFYVSDIIDTLSRISSGSYRDGIIARTEAVIERERYSNNYFPNLLLKAKVYMALGQYKDEEKFKEAEKIYKELINISPFFPDPYRTLGRMYYLAGDYDKSIVIYKEALSVLPDESLYLVEYFGHRDKMHGFKMHILNDLAEVYIKKGDYNMALESYGSIIRINPYRLDIYKKMADTYYMQDDMDNALKYAKRGYMLGVNDYNWPFAIALLYEELGNKSNTLLYARQAQDLVPDNMEVKDLIQRNQ